jgi:serine/threonine-protein kinase
LVEPVPRAIAARRFEIRELLGRGGMGDVYRAWDAELEIDVALKSLRASAAHDPKVLERFRREARLARRIKHVNVAPIHDIVEIDGARYLIMEYVDGKPLSALVATKGPLPLHVALGVMRQICSGVQAAHDVGVIHRDLKPHNVMITRKRGRAVVLDFGIARECGAGDTTEAGIILGSPQYMSYEQLSGEPATPCSDLYALGIVLYEIVTGVSPFRVPGASPSTLRALREIPPDPRQHSPGLPPFVAEVVLRCLQRRPEHRFSSAGALSAALAPEAGSATPLAPADVGEVESGDFSIADAPSALVAVPEGPDRDALVDRLQRLGIEVTPVGDGLAAVSRCYERAFDLVVLAAGLPGMDGLTACQVLRKSPTCQASRLMALLPAGDSDRESFARQVGVDDVIHEPLNVHAFARSVRSLLAE